MFGIAVHKVDLRGPRTGDLLLGDAIWPEPGGVNMTADEKYENNLCDA